MEKSKSLKSDRKGIHLSEKVKNISFLTLCGLTLATAIQTDFIHYIPSIRVLAHVAGGLIAPTLGSFYTGLIHDGILDIRDFFKSKFSKSEPSKLMQEKQKEKDNKRHRIVSIIGTALAFGLYYSINIPHEISQFQTTGIFQTGQYLADTLCPIISIATLGALDSRGLINAINKKGFIKERFTTNKKENTIQKIKDIPSKLSYIEINVPKNMGDNKNNTVQNNLSKESNKKDLER